MDIYEALTRDHEELKPLLDELVMASENDQSTKQLLDEIRDHLVPHARAEEVVFYNTLRKFDGIKDTVAHGYGEHIQAETILRTLRGLEKINIEWTAAAEKLRESLLHHIKEEETEIFSQARQVLSDNEAQRLAFAFEAAKQKAEEQGDMKNTLDMIGNMMPRQFSGAAKASDLPGSPGHP